MDCFSGDKCMRHSAELAFRGMRVAMKERIEDNQGENAIAQELKSFVIGGDLEALLTHLVEGAARGGGVYDGTVRERVCQKGGGAEVVLQDVLHAVKLRLGQDVNRGLCALRDDCGRGGEQQRVCGGAPRARRADHAERRRERRGQHDELRGCREGERCAPQWRGARAALSARARWRGAGFRLGKTAPTWPAPPRGQRGGARI